MIFLIHSFIVGHLGYFHSLTIVNSAAINMGVQKVPLYPGLHSFGYMPRTSIVETYGRSILVCAGISILLSIVVDLIYISTNSVQRLLFPQIFTSIYSCLYS
jgi:hypothetical protein